MRPKTKIYNKFAGESRKRKLGNVLLGLVLLSVILTISLWMIIELMNVANILSGSPWDEIKKGDLAHLLALFIISFSSSALYISYYKGIREISKAAPRYLLVIAVLIVIARLLFRF